LATNTSLNPTK